jgi:hypothetical protein
MVPACCLPLWGRERVPLIDFLKRMESDMVSPEPGFLKNQKYPFGKPSMAFRFKSN